MFVSLIVPAWIPKKNGLIKEAKIIVKLFFTFLAPC